MRTPISLFIVSLAGLLAIPEARLAYAQTSNLPPQVTISWPLTNCSFGNVFGEGALLKLNAEASDQDGSVDSVQFFADTNLLGVVTNPPFSLIWTASPLGSSRLIGAVAVDNLGACAQAAPVFVAVRHFPGPTVFTVTAPSHNSIQPVSGPAQFEAELLSSGGDLFPIEFFVGSNSVGVVTQTGPFTAATPPYSLTTTNLPAGEYTVQVKDLNGFAYTSFAPDSCSSATVRISEIGLDSLRLTPSNRFEFDVITSFPTNEHVIESSLNTSNWTSLATNVPLTNTFPFTDPEPATPPQRIYRAVVP